MADLKFDRKRLLVDKLIPYGFTKANDGYLYTAMLLEGVFRMEVNISADETITTHLFDINSDEEYVLHLVTGSVGEFVGQVRQEYDDVLDDISEKCFEADIFKTEQARQIIEYARIKYGNEPEYLWEKFPDNAVLRRPDNRKWYAAILTVVKSKLGIKSDETAEIIDLRIQPEKMEGLIDNERFFPGWHMNKKHWYTICLDDSVSIEEIYDRIDISYKLAMK